MVIKINKVVMITINHDSIFMIYLPDVNHMYIYKGASDDLLGI